MRTLFLNPPAFSRFDSAGARFAATRKTHSLWFPAWLGYAAAFVPNSKLIDCPASKMDLNKLISQINNYDLVVIYTSTPSFKNDLLVAEKIKATYPEIKIVFTGPHASVLDKETLEASKSIDAIARKEFEETILEITQGKNWSKIKGLSFQRNNKIIRNPDRPPLLDLDRIPSVSKIYKRDLPLSSYHLPFCLHPYIAIYAGRGCPNLCTFCLWPQTFTGRRYRKRTVGNVIEEIKWIKRKLPEIKEIFFDDDTFTVDRNWVKDLCKQVKPLNVNWSCNVRADLPFELLKQMKEAGCRVLVVGFESGNEEILKRIKKGETIKQMKEFTKDAKKAGLMIHGTFLLGLPGENQKTIEETLKFALELDPETIQATIATPLPGTEFYAECQTHGFLKNDSPVDLDGYQAPVVSYPHLTSKEIYQAVERFHFKFYFRPEYLFKTAKKALSSPDEGKRIFLSGMEYGKYLLKNLHTII